MAVELGDHASGFRHAEVIKFINNEILINGGGPEFYMALRWRPWSEIEDQLRAILVDPLVPRTLKRAYTWSALALGVRAGARQREPQAFLVAQPQHQQMGERQTVPRAPVSELWLLRQQREEAITQLLSTQASLQQVVRECDMLRRRLIQFERSAQLIPLTHGAVPGPQAAHLGAAMVPMNVEHPRVLGAIGGHDRQYLEAQMSAMTGVVYVPTTPTPSTWSVPVQSPVSVSVPCQLPSHPAFQMGSLVLPSLTSSVVVETDAGVVPVQMPSVYSSAPFAAPCSQGMTPLWDSRYCVVAEGPQISQQSVIVEESSSTSTEGNAERTQERETLEEGGSHIQGEVPQGGQEMAAIADVENNTEEEYQQNPQGMLLPSESEVHSQDEKSSQAMETLSDHLRQGLQESVGGAEASPMWESWSPAERETPKREQCKASVPKQPQASENQPVLLSARGNWACPRCKATNFSWRKVCYKCKKICMPVGFGGADPGQPR